MSIFPLLGEATLTVILSTHQVPLETLLDCSLRQMCYCHIFSRMDSTTCLPTHTFCSNLASSVSPGTELTLKDGSFNGYATMDYVA